jgi:hypothetical protein
MATYIAFRNTELSKKQFEKILDNEINSFHIGNDFYDEYGAVIRTLSFGIHHLLQLAPMGELIIRDLFEFPNDESEIHLHLVTRCDEFTENEGPQKQLVESIFDPYRDPIEEKTLHVLSRMAEKYDFNFEAGQILKHITLMHMLEPEPQLLLPQYAQSFRIS